MDPLKSTATLLFIFSLLSLHYKAIYGDSSVLLLDSPTRCYFRHSSDQIRSSIILALQSLLTRTKLNLSLKKLLSTDLGINGSIPGFVGGFKDLNGMYLSFNLLSGSIPVEIGENCGKLEHLELSGGMGAVFRWLSFVKKKNLGS